MWAHWRHLANVIKLVLPSAQPSPQPNRQIDRFSRFCTARGRKSIYFTMGDTFPQNCPFPWGIWTACVTYDFVGSFDPTTQTGSWSIQLLLHRWPQGVPILYNGSPLFAINIAPYYRGSGLPANIWFSGPTWVLNPNGISFGVAVFAGLTSVTYRQTDRPTDHATRSVTIGRIYIRSTARNYLCILCGWWATFHFT